MNIYAKILNGIQIVVKSIEHLTYICYYLHSLVLLAAQNCSLMH